MSATYLAEKQPALNKQLLDASKRGNVSDITEAMQNGADVDAKDDWHSTALHKAAFCGFEDGVKVLLEAGAEVSAQNVDNSTPLHWAAFNRPSGGI